MKKISIFWSCLVAILAMGVSYVSTNLNILLTGEKTILKCWQTLSDVRTNILLPGEKSLLKYWLTLSDISTNILLPGEKSLLKYSRTLSDWIASGSKSVADNNVLFINVSHDKQLVDITDEFGLFPIGNAAITDRQKLYQLLQLIDSSQTYQYVMLDVFFGDGYTTDIDSSLFALISRMDRLVLPRHNDGRLADESLYSKAAYADYVTSISENDFAKYPLIWKDVPSMPLRIYEDITNHTVRKKCFWYSDGGSLSRKVIFPKMHVCVGPSRRPGGETPYRNLGEDIIKHIDDADIDWVDSFKEKFVVIGSFDEDDIHSTYAGEISGSLINYNVYLSLMKGQHKIPFSLILFYFIVFFSMAYLILQRDAESSLPWAWVMSKLFALYSIVMIAVCIFVFTVWGQAHDILITSTFFSIVDWVNRHSSHSKKKKNA